MVAYFPVGNASRGDGVVMGERTEARVVVVGTGFSGLGMAIQLKKAGIDDFVVLEKAADVGGTWRDNSYPGCACDIQSHMYSFSFEQNPGWTRSFSSQPEIWDYLRRVCGEVRPWQAHPLRRGDDRGAVGRRGAGLARADRLWRRVRRAVRGVGGRRAAHPERAEAAGTGGFTGEVFHSARWNHDYDLRGKRVAVIGTGASAIQFVPQIAKDVERLDLYQRTPPWIMPKPDHAMPGWAKALFKVLPPAQRAYRDLLYWLLEVRAIGFNGHPRLLQAAEGLAKRAMARQIPDRELRRKVTPDYRMGCKRVLVSNDYYPALSRDNVDVITDGVAEVLERSVVDAQGVEREVDAIIFGTGFHVTDAFDNLAVIGRDGRDLAKTWASEGMRTHLGISVAGFPNLFFLLGTEHRAGAQLGRVHDRVADPLRRRRDRAGRGEPGGRDRGARRCAGPVQRGHPAQTGARGVDAGRLHELVPGRKGREPDDLAGVHLAVLAGHAERAPRRLRADGAAGSASGGVRVVDKITFAGDFSLISASNCRRRR